MAKKENISYVKIENANMIKLSLKQLAGLYTDYAHLVLDIKKLSDKKQEMRKELFTKMKDIETIYSAFVKDLPKLPEAPNLPKPEYPVDTGKTVEYTGMEDPFEELKSEFESIRNELEKIR